MILEPISIATGGYIGIGPGAGDFCPLPIAIGTDGYVRFEVVQEGGGHGGVIRFPQPITQEAVDDEDEQLALLALFAIEEFYE